MKSYRRYIFSFLAVVFFLMGLVGAFNFLVDPYGVMGNLSIVGFNKVKSENHNHVRLFKALAITKLTPKSVFLGSSRAEVGLDPNHPALEDYQPVYNLGITGGNIYEAKRYLQHAIANQPDLKLVVLGLDFFMFNQFGKLTPSFRENRLEQTSITFQDAWEVLFSLDALISSKLTIIRNRNEPNATGHFYQNGMRDTPYFIRETYHNQPQEIIFVEVLKAFRTRPEFYQKYQLSESNMNDLKSLINICRQRGIKLELFISPCHATEWEVIRDAGFWPVFEEWKRRIVAMSPVWDFSGYNSITIESISNNMKNYIESSHYRKEVGDVVINRIFQYREETQPRDFGVLLTPDNVEAQLAKIRSDRELWAKNNPDTVQLVKNLEPNPNCEFCNGVENFLK